MVSKTDSVTVEVDTTSPANCDLFFQPIRNRVRGTLTFSKAAEPAAMKLAAEFGDRVPGQRIQLDAKAGKGFVLEPLRFPEHSDLREKIEQKGLAVPPERKEFPADVESWLWHLCRAVQAGLARVVEGRLPDNPERPKAAKRGVSNDEELAALRGENADLRSQVSKQARQVDSLCGSVQQILAKLK